MFNIINLAAVGALEEAEILANRPLRTRLPQTQNPLDSLSDINFVRQYRLSKALTENVIDMVTPYIAEPVRSDGMSIARKVFVTLRFLASGSYQLDIGRNLHHCVSQYSVSKAIQEVTDALNQPNILNRFIKLPRNMDELRHTRTRFFVEKQFPGVVGCVDCTHVAIFPPPVHDEVAYVNRKGYHSINVQLVCDSDLKIMNVCARFPGSTHDAYIWNNSRALNYIQNLHQNGQTSYYLLGDSGYTLRPWLLTPIPNAQPDTPEARFNERQMSTRSLIEQCNGVLKLRFRCLLKHRVLHYAPERCAKIINSCCILHNMCIEHDIPNVEFGDDEGDQYIDIDFGMYDYHHVPEEAVPNPNNRINPYLLEARRIQQNIAHNFFL